MNTKVINIDAGNYAQYINQDSGIVLLDIWAEWCNPCKQLSPILDEIADIYASEVLILKLNADENQDVTEKLNVRGLPTMIVMNNGEELERLLGLTSKTRIAQVLDQHLGA